MMRLFLDPPIITSSETRLWLDCCDAQSESGGGHLQRIDGVGAVSGRSRIATDWCAANRMAARGSGPVPDSCGAANTGDLDDLDCGVFHEQRGQYILLGAARLRHPYD